MTTNSQTKADVIMEQVLQDCKDIRFFIAAYKHKPSANKKRCIKGMVFDCARDLVNKTMITDKRLQRFMLQHFLEQYNKTLNLDNL